MSKKITFIPYPDEQLQTVAFPPQCPVYVYNSHSPAHVMGSGVVSEVLIGLDPKGPSMYYKVNLVKANTNGNIREGNGDSVHDIFHCTRLRYRNGCTVTVDMGKTSQVGHNEENFEEGIILGCCDIPQSQQSAILKKVGQGTLSLYTFWYSLYLPSSCSDDDGLRRGVMHEVNPDFVKYSPLTTATSSTVVKASTAPRTTIEPSNPTASAYTNSATASIDASAHVSPQHEMEMREDRAPMNIISVLKSVDRGEGRSSSSITKNISCEMEPSDLEGKIDNNPQQNIQRKEPKWLLNASIRSNESITNALENDVSSLAPNDCLNLGNDSPHALTASTRQIDEKNIKASSEQGTQSTSLSTSHTACQDSLESRDHFEPDFIPSSPWQDVTGNNSLAEVLLHLPPSLKLGKQSGIVSHTLRAFRKSDIDLQIELIKDVRTNVPAILTQPFHAYKLTGTNVTLLECAKQHLMHQLENLVTLEKRSELRTYLTEMNKKKTFIPRKELNAMTSSPTTSIPAKIPIIEALNAPLSSSRKRKSECVADRTDSDELTKDNNQYISSSTNNSYRGGFPDEVSRHEQSRNATYDLENESSGQSEYVTYRLDINMPLHLLAKLAFGGANAPQLQGFMRDMNCDVVLHSKYFHESSSQIYFHAGLDRTAKEGIASLKKRLASKVKNNMYLQSAKTSEPEKVLLGTAKYVRRLTIPCHDRVANGYTLSSMIRGE